jgi:hypothetical protein
MFAGKFDSPDSQAYRDPGLCDFLQKFLVPGETSPDQARQSLVDYHADHTAFRGHLHEASYAVCRCRLLDIFAQILDAPQMSPRRIFPRLAKPPLVRRLREVSFSFPQP